MSHFELGDIFNFDVGFDDDEDSFKERPVIVVAIEKDYYFLISTTSKKYDPPRKYDPYKIPILNWRKIGFPEMSWIRGWKPLLMFSIEEFESNVTPENYIGRLSPTDFNLLINQKLPQIYLNAKKNHVV